MEDRMTLEALTDLDVAFGWDTTQSGVADLKSVVMEARGLQLTVVSGQCNGGVAMTVSGITTSDTIIAAWELPTGSPTGSTIVNRTASTQVTAASTVTCNEGLSSTSLFFVLWFDKTGR
jgi:hypothetical protein